MSSFKYFTFNSLFQCSGEETFVSQSQQVALSSTVLDKSTSSVRSSRSKRRSSRRSNINKDDILSFIMSRSPEASSKSPIPTNTEATEGSDSETDDDDESWRHQQSVHGSVQKYLSKPPDAGQSVLISGNVKSRTRAHLSAPKAQVRTNLIGLHDTILI